MAYILKIQIHVAYILKIQIYVAYILKIQIYVAYILKIQLTFTLQYKTIIYIEPTVLTQVLAFTQVWAFCDAGP